MGKSVLFVSIILLVSLASGGGCNMFGDLGDKTSDDAVMDDVKNFMDASLWNDAILKWNLLSAEGKAKRANKVVLASAYAGRGKLDILNVINNINTGGANFFLILMKAFKGVTPVHIYDHITAESIMLGISTTASGRTTDENIFTMFVEFAKLGSIMAAYADVDGNGVVDATFDNCSAYNSQSLFLKHFITGIGIMIESLNATGSSIAGSAVGDLSTNCATVEAAIGVPGICSRTNISDVTAPEEVAAETLIGESHLGLGLAVSTSVDTYEFTVPTFAGAPCFGAAPCPCP